MNAIFNRNQHVMRYSTMKKPVQKMVKYNGKIIASLFILICISDPAFAMLSNLIPIEHKIARTLRVVVDQATKHRFNPIFTSPHHNFSTTEKTKGNSEPSPILYEGCAFRAKKSTSTSVSLNNPFHDICFDYQRLSAEMSVRFFTEDVFESELDKKINENKKGILLEFEKVKNAREGNDPTSDIMCGSLKQDAYDVWQINTSTYDHRRLMFPTFKYLLSLCYHFPNFCFLTKGDIKNIYVDSIRDSINNHSYVPERIFRLLGKSKIPTHAFTATDFEECLKTAAVNGDKEFKIDVLTRLFLSTTKK